MIPFKGTLTEEERWDVINYIRALGSNKIMPIEQYGARLMILSFKLLNKQRC